MKNMQKTFAAAGCHRSCAQKHRAWVVCAFPRCVLEERMRSELLGAPFPELVPKKCCGEGERVQASSRGLIQPCPCCVNE